MSETAKLMAELTRQAMKERKAKPSGAVCDCGGMLQKCHDGHLECPVCGKRVQKAG